MVEAEMVIPSSWTSEPNQGHRGLGALKTTQQFALERQEESRKQYLLTLDFLP